MKTAEELKEIMLHFEQMNDRAGWDQLPELIVHDAEGLNIVGIAGGGDPIEAFRFLPRFNNIEFLIFIIETWVYPQHVLDQFDSLESLAEYAQRQPPAEHPQRLECRLVFGLTPDYEACLRRIRGQEIEFEKDDAERGGRVIEALRQMIRKPPPPQQLFSEN